MTNKRIPIILAIIGIFNAILIYFAYTKGLNKEPLTFYFEERQAVTFLSALLLGATSLTALIIAFVNRQTLKAGDFFNFWFLSGIGFFYLCMDEYFMAHEGIDSAIFKLFGETPAAETFDGVVVGVMGLIALGVCIKFRHEIFKYKAFILLAFLGGVGLAGTVLFHLLEGFVGHHKGVVIEESFKIVGVTCFFAAYQTALYDRLKEVLT